MLHFLLVIVCMLVIRHFSPPLYRFLNGLFAVLFFLCLLGIGFVVWAATHECEFDRMLGNPPSAQCATPRRSGAVAPRRQSGENYGAAAERWRRRLAGDEAQR